jgi:hypothetical protein
MHPYRRARHDLQEDAAQPDQIAHRFVIGVGHPDGRQLSRPMKTGERRVATICARSLSLAGSR